MTRIHEDDMGWTDDERSRKHEMKGLAGIIGEEYPEELPPPLGWWVSQTAEAHETLMRRLREDWTNVEG